jgi:hypothetical protein
MRRLAILFTGVVAAMAAAAPAHAAKNYPVIGFGEQRASVFHNPHWQKLGLPDVRLVVGWDALRYKWQRREIDHWMQAAEQANARPLVAFSRSRAHWRRRMLPHPNEYRRWFLRFRERYPWVRNYLAWNEANHCSQPTCHRPDMAARYFDAMKGACPNCNVVAADVLDTSDMRGWLKAFKRHARHTPRIWGLHNYLDANYFRTTGTRTLLRTVKGQVWFTETGGLVNRKGVSPHRFNDSRAHAARAMRFRFDRLVHLSPRLKRVYVDPFVNKGRDANWDSGVLDPHGRPRPSFNVLTRFLARAERARRARDG